MPTALAYIGAAIAEIAGCFAFWAWLKHDKSVWWLVPGIAALALFAYLLTLIDTQHAGRAYAAYGGVYIAAALLWLWIIEGAKPIAGISLAPPSASLEPDSSYSAPGPSN